MTDTTPTSIRRNREIPALFAAFAACFAAAAVGGMAVSQTLRSWYVQLDKPGWNPPNWVFGPVWTLLYAMMAVSVWLVWKHRHENRGAARSALLWFGVQLVLNTAWSFVFFAWRRPDWAFAEIIVLWLAIVMTILTSGRIHRVAPLLLVPYLLWVTFAATLNGVIWRLNS